MSEQKLGNRAVVIGSGFGGLLAGRVLSDYFREVVIVEKDEEPTNSLPRKGVPQGRHIHVLLNAGEQVMEDLFPGVRDDLLRAGSKTAVLGKDVRWHLAGKWMPPFEGGMMTFFQSRPMLEFVLRLRVSNIDNISFLYSKRSLNFRFSTDRKKLEAVVLKDVKTGIENEEKADFFVEAAGAGTDLLKQLAASGYPVPSESVVEPDFAYSSGLFKIPEDWPDTWKSILIYPKAPNDTRGGAFVPVEDGNWMVTAAGYSGDYPPADLMGFLDFLKSLPKPDVFDAVSRAELIGEIEAFKFKKGVRRHFEDLKKFPDGLVALGDAVCRANPFFGQGITVAALEARSLQKNLERVRTSEGVVPSDFARVFFQDVAKILNVSWEMAVGEDFKYPETRGKRPARFAVSRWFKDRIMAANDPEVAKQFYKVMHFVDKPTKLLTAQMLYRTFIKR
ncbi:MAG: FAD-dependent monooxygenase [Sneathiella sp.]|nr:FAD-dependent monooxygenase [Sneathiella sp.]